MNLEPREICSNVQKINIKTVRATFTTHHMNRELYTFFLYIYIIFEGTYFKVLYYEETALAKQDKMQTE